MSKIDKCKKGGRKGRKFTLIVIAVFVFAFLSGIAFARLASVQKILNDVWSNSDDALQVSISL